MQSNPAFSDTKDFWRQDKKLAKPSLNFFILGFITSYHTLQRHNPENSKQIFTVKELYGLSPNFHIQVSVTMRDLDIPIIGLPILLQENMWTYLGNILYKSLLDTWMWKLVLRPRIPFLEMHKWDFRCSSKSELCKECSVLLLSSSRRNAQKIINTSCMILHFVIFL